jgi:large subunit ribosomal protein L24
MQTARPVTKPTKQRKMLYDAADHVRHRLLGAHLSPELRATHIVRSFPVRSGDTIRVMRGDHKGFEGKITRVDLKKYRIYVEGLTREKVDGTTVFLQVHPSKVMITRLNLDDKWRKRILERKQKAKKKPQEPAKKPKLEAVYELPETAELKQPSEEKVTAVEKPRARAKRRPSKRGKKAKEEATEKKVQAGETKAEKKPRVQRKRTKRKGTKKTEEGEG